MQLTHLQTNFEKLRPFQSMKRLFVLLAALILAVSALQYVFFVQRSASALFDSGENMMKGIGGATPDGIGFNSSISGDGNIVTYISSSTNLVAGDTNGFNDLFLYNTSSAQTTAISRNLGGSFGDDNTESGMISRDGTTAIFVTSATNLGGGPTVGTKHIYHHDIATGENNLIATGYNRVQSLDISGDGNVIVFSGRTGSTGSEDVFVHEFSTSTTTMLTDSASEATRSYSDVVISSDGLWLLYRRFDSSDNINAILRYNLATDTFRIADFGVNNSVFVTGHDLSEDGLTGSWVIEYSDGSQADFVRVVNFHPTDQSGESDIVTTLYTVDMAGGESIGSSSSITNDGLSVTYKVRDGLSGSRVQVQNTQTGAIDQLCDGDGCELTFNGNILSDDASRLVVNFNSDFDVSLPYLFQQTEASVLCDGLMPTIEGTEGDDVLVGTAGADVIHGLGGNDNISGLDGNDVICGGDGDDYIDAGQGGDTVFGGEGHDTIYGRGGWDTIRGDNGMDIIRGGWGNDTLNGNGGFDTINGGEHDDTINAGWGNDTVDGGNGDDTIDGNVGNDVIKGGAGTNTCSNAELEEECGAPPA